MTYLIYLVIPYTVGLMLLFAKCMQFHYETETLARMIHELSHKISGEFKDINADIILLKSSVTKLKKRTVRKKTNVKPRNVS